MVYCIGSYTIQISLVALCLLMLEMKAQNSTAVLGRQLHSLLGCYTLSPCEDNLKLLPSIWWWDFIVLWCNAIERAVLGLLVKCAQICHGREFQQQWQWGCSARPLFPAAAAEAECKISPQSNFICWPEYPKKFLCSATAWPSEMLVWVKGSEQSPPSSSIVGISKETNSLLQLPLAAFPSKCTHECSIISSNKPVYWWACLCSLGVSSSPNQ